MPILIPIIQNNTNNDNTNRTHFHSYTYNENNCNPQKSVGKVATDMFSSATTLGTALIDLKRCFDRNKQILKQRKSNQTKQSTSTHNKLQFQCQFFDSILNIGKGAVEKIGLLHLQCCQKNFSTFRLLLEEWDVIFATLMSLCTNDFLDFKNILCPQKKKKNKPETPNSHHIVLSRVQQQDQEVHVSLLRSAPWV